MKKIRKAVIPAAGLGTRFLPATKTVPKEMLTIVDAPIIFYVVEEAVKAGIEDIVLIQGRNKEAIEDFFDTSYEVEALLERTGKTEILSRLQKLREMVNLVSVRQKQALGLGHAISCAERVIGNEPFAVLLGDEIMVGEPTALEDLVQCYDQTGSSCISVMKVLAEEVSKYGIADIKEVEGLLKVQGLVEKPKPGSAPSLWALPGRYVLNPEVFKFINESKPTVGGEIQLTDALDRMSKKRDMLARPLKCDRYDAGDKLGYLIANIEIGLSHPELGADLKSFILKKSAQLKGKI